MLIIIYLNNSFNILFTPIEKFFALYNKILSIIKKYLLVIINYHEINFYAFRYQIHVNYLTLFFSEDKPTKSVGTRSLKI